VPVDGSAIGFIAGQRISPALTDALLSIRRIGVTSLKADRPDNGTDNIDAPMDGPGQVYGSYSGPVLRHSALTTVLSRLPRPGEVLTAILSRLHHTRVNSPT
jgi:hypothetical protein